MKLRLAVSFRAAKNTAFGKFPKMKDWVTSRSEKYFCCWKRYEEFFLQDWVWLWRCTCHSPGDRQLRVWDHAAAAGGQETKFLIFSCCFWQTGFRNNGQGLFFFLRGWRWCLSCQEFTLLCEQDLSLKWGNDHFENHDHVCVDKPRVTTSSHPVLTGFLCTVCLCFLSLSYVTSEGEL